MADEKMIAWGPESRHARMIRCARMLHIHSALTEAEFRRVLRRLLKGGTKTKESK